jgi:hypothetical protein
LGFAAGLALARDFAFTAGFVLGADFTLDEDAAFVEDFAAPDGFDLPAPLSVIASRTSALKADSSTTCPSWISIARRTLPSRLELKRRVGSFSAAALGEGELHHGLVGFPGADHAVV